jgi:hypothetical protein
MTALAHACAPVTPTPADARSARTLATLTLGAAQSLAPLIFRAVASPLTEPMGAA